ncbi:hypothetical protein J2T22_001609 [Pseudarthrobacter defluvii]|uniref:Uncharacterized protein n=1 Tax=Pseudarthrobacter defluvii TaxID=410837 RepID=A0ABT9UFL8_9MICC|nr:hypothetical protein [Pseudarthrobacter defluvii]
MWVTFASVFPVIFVASMILCDQWLTADQRHQSKHYKKTRWSSMRIGFTLSALFLLLSVMAN